MPCAFALRCSPSGFSCVASIELYRRLASDRIDLVGVMMVMINSHYSGDILLWLVSFGDVAVVVVVTVVAVVVVSVGAVVVFVVAIVESSV